MASRGSEADGGESVGRRSSVGGGGWGVTLQETAFGATNPALGAGAGSEREAGRRRGSSVVDDRAASAGDVGMRVTVDRDLVEAARGGALAVPLTELAGRMERSAVTSTSAVTRTSIRPRALVAELMQSQQPLLVLEFSKVRYSRRCQVAHVAAPPLLTCVRDPARQ
ncbi:hypothetical protein EON62_01965 [archaeon]|nr:MAG: hypothetical protein EON62_01965 [archaeon]